MLQPATSGSFPKILHLEDNPADAELIHLQLRDEWPGCSILRVTRREEFETALRQEAFDLILSDFSLPAFNGLEALTLAQKTGSAAPFVFLSGTIGEDNAVEALKCGAADYIIKDRPARLISAIRQALARMEETERRHRSEEQLREQAMLLDKARDAIIATDLDHRITYWNVSAERIYGWAAAEVLGSRLEELQLHVEPERFAAALRTLEVADEWRGELRLQIRDGSIIQVEGSWSLVRDAAGRPRSVLFIDSDVTERKKLEAQLLRTERLDSIGMLAGGVAHDLNNALAPVLMAAELLRMRLSGPDLRLVDNIETSARHGAALVQQLLAFARGTEGQHTELDVVELIHDVGKLLRSTFSRSIDLEVVTPATLWKVCADTTKLKQALVNLSLNARDAMPQGGRIEISAENTLVPETLARLHPGAESGPHVRVVVRDNGSGIPPGVLDKIFDPFFTTKPAGKGTGLGLSMVAGIVKNHRGFFNVETQLGRGSMFELYFPAGPKVAQESGDRADFATAAGCGEKILLIDDDPAVRDTFQLLLEKAGYRVSVAAGGDSGLDAYDRGSQAFAVVITDMMMPGMRGAEVITALRSRNPQQPILAISGFLKVGDMESLRRLTPSVEFLSKPIPAETLLVTLKRLVGTGAGRS